jgi:hypothetical protein
MTSRPARITFNEAVRCARIVGCTIQHIAEDRLKAKPIIFKPRGDILSKLSASSKVSVFSMKNTTEQKKNEKILINGWSVDINMRLYYEDPTKRDIIRTTPVIAIDGNVVTTRSGSVYKLGKLDVLIAKHLANTQMSDSSPLEEETLPFLVNAAYDVYPGFYESFG